MKETNIVLLDSLLIYLVLLVYFEIRLLARLIDRFKIGLLYLI